VKTDRSSSASTRAAAVVLAGLLLAAGAAGQSITFSFKRKSTAKVTTEGVAAVLARQVGEVRNRFDKDRRALRTVPGPGGEPAYPREEVAGLIARTEKDLDQAIEQVGEPGLDALRAWSAEELRRVREELAPPPGQTASSPKFFSPRAVARIASLGGLPEPPGVVAASAQPETIAAGTSESLLDWVGEVVGRIFFLAEKDDLEVDLWVGSTPAPATFRFWSQGKIRGAAPAPRIIETNGRRERVLRGLYVYRAAWTRGAVTELVEYPAPAGTAADQSERLDLVNGSSFFCCRFSGQYCRHVASEKECRP
jgi:hypothetical protein